MGKKCYWDKNFEVISYKVSSYCEREREREQIEQVITKKLTLILDKVDDINKFD